MRSETSFSSDVDEEHLEIEPTTAVLPKAEDAEAVTATGLERLNTLREPTEKITDLSVRKRRGRPPKQAIPFKQPNQPKTIGMRSKTGCLTCRKRKKKCDEAKPSCKSNE